MSDEEDETTEDIAYTLNDGDPTKFEQALHSPIDSPHMPHNGYNFSDSFKRFHLQSYEKAKLFGLFINANIHEIL